MVSKLARERRGGIAMNRRKGFSTMVYSFLLSLFAEAVTRLPFNSGLSHTLDYLIAKAEEE
jgi:hypothetical protein